MKIFVHGGVSGVAKELSTSLRPAVEVGTACSAAVDAVEAAVASLEDEPSLNAGYGAALNAAGELELDAGVAYTTRSRAAGTSIVAGAVAGVQVRNPIRVARVVAEQTPHVLMVGAGANRLAREAGLEAMEDTTPQQRERWRRAVAEREFDPERFGEADHVDTVGAIALDDDGNLAAASSTGGVFGQLAGRVGDAPLFGAGFYVSRDVAVVGTGVGEAFIETLACRSVGDAVARGVPVLDACLGTIRDLATHTTSAGVLALDREGRVGAAYIGGAWRVEGPDGVVRPDEIAFGTA